MAQSRWNQEFQCSRIISSLNALKFDLQTRLSRWFVIRIRRDPIFWIRILILDDKIQNVDCSRIISSSNALDFASKSVYLGVWPFESDET